MLDNKQFRLIVLIIALLFLVITGCGGGTSQTGSKPEAQKQDIDWETAEVTAENVKGALSRKAEVSPIFRDNDFPKDITKIEVIDHAVKPGQKNVHIYFKPETFWDETDFVKKVGGTSILASSILYRNPKIEDVVFFALTDMTDQYGKTETEVVVKLGLNREVANKVDWKGLADRHTTDPGNIYRIAATRYIHLGVLKNVKQNEVNL
ncbi:MAG TPA: hypothetical protein EYP19_03845 [Desulfobacterales bacterium]|nr:hypothetical protein [Desulfobacterales bacterium]